MNNNNNNTEPNWCLGDNGERLYIPDTPLRPDVSEFVVRLSDGVLYCSLHGSHRCADVRLVRKAGEPYRKESNR